MNIFLKSSNFLLACSLVLSFSSNVYANDLYANNLLSHSSELSKPINIQSKQIKQEKIKQNLNAQLLIAAQNGNIKEVRSLISQATDVNVRDEYGWTPILWAAMNGHTDVVRVLLVSGANPNTRNKYGWTPLMWAAGQGFGEIVRSLIASGARLNAQDRNGWTAMMWAWDGNHQETVAILRSVANN
ncbi:MAG: ankyrin repeat domain-containing protein [Pseudanabaena sp.]|jgi:ankyrin repeat protein